MKIFSAILLTFIGAILGYVVRIVTARRGDRKRQQRLAILYLVRIGQLNALKKAVEIGFKEEIESLKKQIEMYGEHAIHYGAVRMAQELNKVNPSKIRENQPVKMLFNQCKSWLSRDPYLGFKIDDELLSNLPAEVIMHYQFFIGKICDFATALQMWISAIEHSDFTYFNSDTIYSQITSLKRIADSAELLILSLVKKSRIKTKQCDKIMDEQFKHATYEVLTLKKNAKIIEIIKQGFDDLEKQKKQ